ncbi:pyridoxal-phosphate dependent enzyme [Achromobacter xylosoxidans]
MGHPAGLAAPAARRPHPAAAAAARGRALCPPVAGAQHRRRARLWEGATDQYSIAGGTVTLQSLEALKRSGGSPVEVSDAAAAQAQQRLERMGVATELSSAAALAAVTRLRRAGQLDAESSVVLILTSDGRRG